MKKTKMLKKNYEFKNVLGKRNYYGGKYIEIFLMNNKEEINYIGIAVSKKIANSVQRNQIKRYIREAYRSLESEIKEGYSIVIMWKKKISIDYASYETIKNDLLFILKRANILKIEENI